MRASAVDSGASDNGAAATSSFQLNRAYISRLEASRQHRSEITDGPSVDDESIS